VRGRVERVTLVNAQEGRHRWAAIERALSSDCDLTHELQAWLHERALAVLAADDEASPAQRPREVTDALGLKRTGRGPAAKNRIRTSNLSSGAHTRFGAYQREVSRACWAIIAKEPLAELNYTAWEWVRDVAREIVIADDQPAQDRYGALLKAAGLSGERRPKLRLDRELGLLEILPPLPPIPLLDREGKPVLDRAGNEVLEGEPSADAFELAHLRAAGIVAKRDPRLDREDLAALKTANKHKLARRARSAGAELVPDDDDPLHFRVIK
jgi:hypothetical protein